MKNAFVYFLALCFFLLGGIKPAYANGSHSAGKHITKHQGADKKENLADVEDEDEDVYQAATQFFIILTFTFALFKLYSHVKKSLPFCAYLSYTSSQKYILQRVLRI